MRFYTCIDYIWKRHGTINLKNFKKIINLRRWKYRIIIYIGLCEILLSSLMKHYVCTIYISYFVHQLVGQSPEIQYFMCWGDKYAERWLKSSWLIHPPENKVSLGAWLVDFFLKVWLVELKALLINVYIYNICRKGDLSRWKWMEYFLFSWGKKKANQTHSCENSLYTRI